MTFAEEAGRELEQLMAKHHKDGPFKKIEQSHQGEKMVIKFLDFHNDTTSPKHLAEKLNLSSARIAALLNTLEKKGQITRSMDPNDRRRVSVTLTQAGKEIALAEKEKLKQRAISIFNKMGEEDTTKFMELLTIFIGYSHQTLAEEEGDQ